MNDSIVRLKQFIKSQEYSINAFEKACGLAVSTVGKTKSVSPNMLRKITEQFPELNPGWLMTGEGEMLRTEQAKQVSVTHNEHGVQNSTFGDNATITGFGPQLEQLETECERLRAENIRLRDENDQLRQQNLKLTDKIINLLH